MVVHYPRTVWKNSYAEHEVTGKTYNYQKKVLPNESGFLGVKNTPDKRIYNWTVPASGSIWVPGAMIGIECWCIKREGPMIDLF